MECVKIGFSTVCITPPLGLGMGGYASKTRVADGVLDELFARVFVFSDGSDCLYLLCQTDLLCVDRPFVEQAQLLLEPLGFLPERINIGSIHTHSGPKGLMSSRGGDDNPVFGPHDSELCAHYLELIKKAAEKALADMDYARVRIGKTAVTGVATNRNNPQAEGDNTVIVFEFIRDDGKKALLYNFGCHPTILNKESTKYSADLPAGVEAAAGGYDMIMFLNGSAGDISTRFTKTESSYDEVMRLGGLLYSGIETALESAIFTDFSQISAQSNTIEVKLKNADTVEAAQEKLEAAKNAYDKAKSAHAPDLRVYESRVEGATVNLERSLISDGRESVTLNIQTLTINGFSLIFISGELFSALSNPIKQAKTNLTFCSYFNGYEGYLPDTTAYDNGTYEALCSPIERGEGERVVQFASENI